MVAFARARGVKVRRLPRAAEPLAIQARYFRRIKARVLEDAMRLVREKLVPHLEELAGNASKIAATKPTADGYADDMLNAVHDAERELGDILDEISDTYFDKWTNREFSKVVRPVADETARFEAGQLNKQLSAAIGERMALNIVGDEPWLQKAVDDFVRENVALLKSIPTTFFDELEKSLSREIADGSRWEDLAETIEERYSVSESKAELIARDQVGKFNGDLNRTRQTSLGIKKFTWRTMGDERVRDDHVARNGVTYEWSDPPEGETPGEPIQCRCWAEGDVMSALEDTE